MKTNWKTRFFALLLCVALLATCFPLTAFAEGAETVVAMTEGDIIAGFAPADAVCESSDPSVAWVDADGCLKALKEGTATVFDGETEYTVNVSDYSDGTPIVGNLKILARYNDNMQFYDGHVYLLFTSYQDGVTINIPDLYAGYQIDGAYYGDIKEDIANGSNHSGNDADKYFTFDDEMTSVTLDRGEVVTIGMYRDFDMSVTDAALGSIKNSSAWDQLSEAGKTVVIENLFRFLGAGIDNTEAALEQLKAVFDEVGADYNQLLDGVVDGGVCFNRELYNQKLEWDQYENVTYELDITAKQLYMMQMYLGGNLNKFSILKNSCATVALRAWNAAVGTGADGEPNAYYLTSTGEGIFAIVDAPKTVRDSIVNNLPGYYLNNAGNVAEPDAGYQDETGWVYVSAPEKVSDIIYNYNNDTLFVDETKTKLSTLINAAKAEQNIFYSKDEQEIDVDVKTSAQDELTTIESVDFTVNGQTVSFNESTPIEEDVWMRALIKDPAEGEDYYVVGADGKALASEFADGWLCFRVPALPFSFKIMSSSEGAQNLLRTVIVNGDKAEAETEVYVKNGDEKIALDAIAEVTGGTKVYVKAAVSEDDFDYLLTDISVNGESVFDDAHFDADEDAYFFTMPAKYSTLSVKYETAEVEALGEPLIQVREGDFIAASDYAKLTIGGQEAEADQLVWNTIVESEEGVVEIAGSELTAKKAGTAVVWVCAAGNENIGVPYSISVYDAAAEMVAITFSDETEKNTLITYTVGDSEEEFISFSGYLVPKGAALHVTPIFESGKAVLYLHANDSTIWPDEPFTVTEDTAVDIRIADAEIKGMPEKIALKAKGDTYQLNAKVQYTGVMQLIPVYDDRIEYLSSDELITVDENGLITVAGDIPEDGAAVYVTATAGSTGGSLTAYTKVVVGDYKGDEIVGKLTVLARRIYEGELVAHGCLTYTTYEDLDLETSYYEYYKPDDRYNDLMIDYEQNPGNYTSDPALCETNDLGLENRESYFDVISRGVYAEPETISLLAGESITLSNYGFDANNFTTIYKALKGSTLYQNSRECQALVYEMDQYLSGGDYDASLTFDALLATLMQIYAITKETGYNPADGVSEGGQCINRELYNQFRRDDSQMPNNFYTVEITRDELAIMKAYLANPANNYYSLLIKNCASGSVDIWNSVLADRPELMLRGNLSGVAVDPESLYFDIGALTAKDNLSDLDGFGGSDFYPRTVRYSDATRDAIEKIKAIGDVAYTDECKEKIDAAREAFDALNDVETARVWNYDTLTAAEEAYAAYQLEADKAEYALYKENTLAMIDMLFAKEDDSAACKLLTDAAKTLIAARPYDEDKTLEENKEAVDMMLMLYGAAITEQRYREHPYLGDVDMDREVTIIDVVTTQRSLALIAPLPVTLSADTYPAADTDGDGKITIMDVTMTQRWLAGLKANENIGKPIG